MCAWRRRRGGQLLLLCAALGRADGRARFAARTPARCPLHPHPSTPHTRRTPAPRSYYGLKPDIKVIAPWREWDLNSRTQMIEFAERNGIEVPQSKRGEPPFSMDANMLHISYEG